MNSASATARFGPRPCLAALVLGIVGLGACGVALALGDTRALVRSWLTSHLLWLGASLGACATLMIGHLTGGAWWVELRRPLEAAARTSVVVALLFVPIIVLRADIYPWVDDPEARGVGHSPLRSMWLEDGFFVARSVGYHIVWIALAFALTFRRRRGTATGAEVDAGAEVEVEVDHRPRLASLGLIVWGLTITFAGIDHVMSLSPEWHSTAYGAKLGVGHAVVGLAFAVFIATALACRDPDRHAAEPSRVWRDTANLQLAFLMLWAYVSFAEYLIIWSGNGVHEIPYYLYRSAGGWPLVAAAMTTLHFFVPFALLLSRRIKSDPRFLGAIAAALVAGRLIDLHWLVAPSIPQGRHIEPIPGISLHWTDAVTPWALGGIWVAAFLWEVDRRPRFASPHAVPHESHTADREADT